MKWGHGGGLGKAAASLGTSGVTSQAPPPTHTHSRILTSDTTFWLFWTTQFL